jgi:neutral amino acid transport system substrate-binding protein
VINTRRPHQGTNAAYLVRDRLNACGGVNQAPITIILREADGTVPSEVNAIKELVDEYQVHGIVAQFASPNPEASIAYIEQTETPLLIAHLNDIDAGIKLASKSQHWGYTTPSSSQQMQAFVETMISQGYSSVILIRSDSQAFNTWQDTFIPVYEAAGGTVLNVDDPMLWRVFKPNEFADGEEARLAERDQNEQLTQLQTLLNREGSEARGAIAVALTPSDGYDFFMTLAQLPAVNNSKPIFWYEQETLAQILDDLPLNNPPFPDAFKTLTNVRGVSPASIGEGFQIFAKSWENRMEEAPTQYSATTWDAVSLMALAAQSAGQNSRSGILSELKSVANSPGTIVTDACQGLELLQSREQIDLEGASGTLEMSRLGEIPGVFNIWRLNGDGELAIVERLTLD